MSALWAQQCASNLHEVVKTSDGSIEEERSLVIDDILLMAQLCEQLTQEVLQLLQLLGFRINWEKSVLTPCRQIIFLGFWVDSHAMVLSLPEDKLQSIILDCRKALWQSTVSARDLAGMIGKNDSSLASDHSSPTLLQKPPATEKYSTQTVPVI